MQEAKLNVTIMKKRKEMEGKKYTFDYDGGVLIQNSKAKNLKNEVIKTVQ